MRLISALLFALALAACSSTSPEKVVFEIRAGYDATVLAPAARYAQLDTCTTPRTNPVCKETQAVAAIQKADAAAAMALDAAETTVRTNPEVNASFAIAAARNAVAAVAAILATYGVK